FWGEVLNDARLAAQLPDHAVVNLRPLGRPALEDIIRRPAELTGPAPSDALVEALVNDALDQPGDLPVLEFVLQQLWLQSDDKSGTMTLAGYRAAGGLQNAIVKRADSVYAALSKSEQEAVPGVFAALIQVGEQRVDLRRRARLAELSDIGQKV